MADTPQKGRKAARDTELAKISRGQVNVDSPVDVQMHRAGALRMLLIALFAFIHTFRKRYKVVLEFSQNQHVDVTEALLMRVRIVARNGVPAGDDE